MPPNVNATDGVDDIARRIEEGLAVVFYCFLIVAAVLPESLWPVPYQTQVLVFIGLIFLVALPPPVFKLTADTFGEFRPLSSYLGEFPFHHWALYYHPLLGREVRGNWPGGLHYPTIVFSDDEELKEHLLLDSTIEPMNISGLVIHFIPSVLRANDPGARQDLIEFLVDFLHLKIDYYQEHGDYSVSRRYLGPLSFPTVNTQVEPPHDIAKEDIEEVNIYYVPWPEDMANFEVTDTEWGNQTDERATMVASYRIDHDGTVTETQFSPTDDM
jgi:hypothetical protein